VPHILIVDDDECICKTLSAILQSEGYQTACATTAKEAIEKTKTQFFNLALLDIKLPDMEGTQLLAKLQEITPETIKIMITGYPSLKNAVEALNFGADSYIMKPIDPAELIKTIKNKLEAQKQTEKISKEKLATWIQSQARKAQTSNFQEFLEETATELTHFGLTKTQAKIYVTLLALGVASASEIAALSKIRREEIYRIIPELEKHGIITRKLKTPRKFSATKPETAIEILTKIKLKAMKEEIDNLKQKQAELTSRLKTIALPI
jgi:DNA-binding NtrC family response regulator